MKVNDEFKIWNKLMDYIVKQRLTINVVVVGSKPTGGKLPLFYYSGTIKCGVEFLQSYT